MGRIYYILKDFDEAINSFKKAFDLNKEDNLSIYLIANTYFRGKEIFEESEKYYEILIKKQIIEEKNLSFVSSILNGYFLSLLYQLKIDKILDSTKNWSTSKNNTLVGILGTFRASAWKRKIELIQKDDHISYSSAIKNSIETFIEVFETIVKNLNKVKKDIQPESILNFEKGDVIQVSNIKGSPAIKKYLNEKGINIKSLIKINDKNKHILSLLVDGDEKIINIEDAADIMVIRNYI
mgnify:CR=1 FL=1